MIIKVRQHIPGFVNDGEGGEETTVESLEQLLALPWVKGWERGDFYQWALSPTGVGHLSGYLMAVVDEGTKWWVVALLDPIAPLLGQLPTWKAPPRPIQEIWIATEEGARKVGEYRGDGFVASVRGFFAEHPDSNFDAYKFTYSGCRFFPTEAEAIKGRST